MTHMACDIIYDLQQMDSSAGIYNIRFQMFTKQNEEKPFKLHLL